MILQILSLFLMSVPQIYLWSWEMWEIRIFRWCYDQGRQRELSRCDEVDISDWHILILSFNNKAEFVITLMLLLLKPESLEERLKLFEYKRKVRLLFGFGLIVYVCHGKITELRKNSLKMSFLGTLSWIKRVCSIWWWWQTCWHIVTTSYLIPNRAIIVPSLSPSS